MDIISLLPTKIPAELLAKVKGQRKGREEWLLFKSGWAAQSPLEPKLPAAECYCTACEKRFYLDRAISDDGCRYAGWSAGIFMPNGDPVFHKNPCLCPLCGCQVEAIHTSSFGNQKKAVMQGWFPMCFQKVGGEFAAISWRVRRIVDRQGKIEWEVMPHEAYYTDGKKLKKAVAWYQYFTATRYMGSWESRSKCQDTFGRIDEYLPPEDEATNGTMFENAKLREYLDSDMLRYPISYLKLYQKRHKVENLVTVGASNVLTGLMADEIKHYYYRGGTCAVPLVNWSAKRPAEMLYMTRGEFRMFLRDIPSEDQPAAYLKWLEYRKFSGAKMEYLREVSEMTVYDIKRFSELGQDSLRVIRYIKKQRRRYPNDHANLTELFDYWRFCNDLRISLDRPEDRWPQRLQSAHDQASDELDRRRDKIQAQKFKRRTEVLSAFSWEDGDLIIRPAASNTELKNEGRELSHCVARYAEDHAMGKTAIFFIRHKDEPKKSFFTLELDEKNLIVRQNRGKHNCARTPEVEAFEKKWLLHLQKLTKKEKKGHGKSKQHGAAAGAA